MRLPCPILSVIKTIKTQVYKRRKSRAFDKGFSFIELLVVAGIISVLTGVGVASYNNFNDKRIVEKTAEELKMNLRSIQSKAMNNEKNVSSCGNSVLSGWYADFSSNQIYGHCGDLINFDSKQLIDLDINDDGTDDLNLSYSGTIFFKVLGGTNLSTAIDITISYKSYSQTVTISPSGDVY